MKIAILLKKLIQKKFYEKEEIINKLNIFFAMAQISEEEYSELMLLIEDVYVEIVEETEEVVEESTAE